MKFATTGRRGCTLVDSHAASLTGSMSTTNHGSGIIGTSTVFPSSIIAATTTSINAGADQLITTMTPATTSGSTKSVTISWFHLVNTVQVTGTIKIYRGNNSTGTLLQSTAISSNQTMSITVDTGSIGTNQLYSLYWNYTDAGGGHPFLTGMAITFTDDTHTATLSGSASCV